MKYSIAIDVKALTNVFLHSVVVFLPQSLENSKIDTSYHAEFNVLCNIFTLTPEISSSEVPPIQKQ